MEVVYALLGLAVVGSLVWLMAYGEHRRSGFGVPPKSRK